MQMTTRSNPKDQMNKSQYRNAIDSYTILKFISKIIISKLCIFFFVLQKSNQAFPIEM